jgi:hypothetical protein
MYTGYTFCWHLFCGNLRLMNNGFKIYIFHCDFSSRLHSSIFYMWRNQQKIWTMLKLWNLWIGIVILFVDLGSHFKKHCCVYSEMKIFPSITMLESHSESPTRVQLFRLFHTMWYLNHSCHFVCFMSALYEAGWVAVWTFSPSRLALQAVKIEI